MAAGNSVSDEIREQRQKLKGKSPKEKLAYFWEYYKVPALIVLLVVIFGSDLIYNIVTKKAIAFRHRRIDKTGTDIRHHNRSSRATRLLAQALQIIDLISF